jgi:hypothetical protein
MVQRPDAAMTASQNSTARIVCQASYAINKTDLVYEWYFNGYPIDFQREVSYVVVSHWCFDVSKEHI